MNKAQHGQGRRGDTNNKAPESERAARALATIAKKLDKHMSVEYTVNELIREARDPMNLAVIFVGEY